MTTLLEVNDVPYGTMTSPYTDTFAPTDGDNFFSTSTIPTRPDAFNVPEPYATRQDVVPALPEMQQQLFQESNVVGFVPYPPTAMQQVPQQFQTPQQFQQMVPAIPSEQEQIFNPYEPMNVEYIPALTQASTQAFPQTEIVYTQSMFPDAIIPPDREHSVINIPDLSDTSLNPKIASLYPNFTTRYNYFSNQSAITSTEIIDSYNDIINILNDPSVDVCKRLAAIAQKIQTTEKLLLQVTIFCDLPTLNSLRNRVGSLNSNVLQSTAHDQFYNPQVMYGTLCAVNSIFYSTLNDDNSIYYNNRIRNYITNLRKVATEHTMGNHILTADLETANNMFIVKTPIDPRNDHLTHELIIGLYGMNSLRKEIPNFIYTYGGFKCSPPMIDHETKEVISWCLHNENAVNYVLLENIGASVTLSEYVKTCTNIQFLNVFVQVLFALNLAYQRINFTHYNLNNNNVVLRKIDQSIFQIRYPTVNNGDYYIMTSFVPTIMNFGLSHIKIPTITDENGAVIVNGQDLGVTTHAPYSVYPQRAWIMHDVYKLLMYCLFDAYQAKNQSVITEGLRLFAFFNPLEDPVTALNTQYQLAYSLPITTFTDHLTIETFLRYILTGNNDFISKQPFELPILDCANMCLTTNDIFARANVDVNAPIQSPKTIIELYDTIKLLRNQGLTDDAQQIGRLFHYNDAMASHIRQMDILITELDQKAQYIRFINVSLLPLETLLQYQTMIDIRNMYQSVAEVVDKTITLEFYRAVGDAVAQGYSDNHALVVLNNIMNTFVECVLPVLEQAKIILSANHQCLNSLHTNEIVVQSLGVDERLNWYWRERYLFDYIFKPLMSTKFQ